MPVKEYLEGEHPSGFIGYRVYHSGGEAGNDQQQYFSIQEHGRKVAKKLAHELSEKWEKAAVELKQKNRLQDPPKRGSEAVIVSGLRADISKRGKSLYVGFYVTIPGTNQSIYFGTKRSGYAAAWREAVVEFCKRYKYKASDKTRLIKKMPSKDLFRGFLLERHNGKGHNLTIEQLESYLSA